MPFGDTLHGIRGEGGNGMNNATLDDLDILAVGHTIQIGGAIWTGNGKVYLVPLPDEDMAGELVTLRMNAAQWERFLDQTDVLDVRGPGKAILRKSQRQIDQWISWEVYARDGYRCRYCGRKAPLTVDHIILWELGGATIVDNLNSACKYCNKTRGNIPYEVWMDHPYYIKVSQALTEDQRAANRALIETLNTIPRAKPRSR